MKTKFSGFLTLLLAFVVQFTFAQEKTITGTVSDETGPLPGVSVVIKGTTTGAETDINGKYSIQASQGDVLVYSFVGMSKKEIKVGASDTINVVMEADNVLDEVIVVGYGTSTKQSFTGTATQIDSEKLASKSTTNISQALAGEVAGVTVINGSGQPGSASTVRIRGFSSVNGNRDPLYVVDGVPFSGNINSINTADIESTTVLKDASATAIYGARGANGVILITTKKGKAGQSKIEMEIKYGTNSRTLPEYQRVENQEQYVELGWESLKNYATINADPDPNAYANNNIFGSAGISPNYNMWDVDGDKLINPATGKFNSGVNRKYTPENWNEQAFGNASRVETNLRLSGGVDKTTYSTSFGFLDDKGYLINSNFKRYTSRVDVGHQVKKWLKGSLNMGYAYIESNQGGQSADATSAFWFANQIPTIYPVFLRDASGNLVPDNIFGGNQYDFGDVNARSFGLGSNPIATTIYDINRTRGHEINGNTMLEASFLKHFKAMARFGVQYRNYSNDQLGNPFYGFSAKTGGDISKQKFELFDYTFLQSISYENEFGLNSLKISLFHETEAFDFYNSSAFKQQLASPFSLELNNAVVNVGSNSYKNEYNIESYFGNINYDYDEKYYGSFVLRNDGSSRFLNNKWGTFYSVGLAWIASKENFLSSADRLNLLKFKLSYGTNGEQAGAGLYSGYDLFDINNLNDKPSFGFSTKGSPDLTWETSKQFQIGTELNINDKFKAELDYYAKTTDDLFFQRRVGPSIGYAIINVNDGSLQNKGFEFNLTGHLIKSNDLTLDINVNGEMLKNNLTAMPIDPATNKQKVLDTAGNFGRSVGHSIFDYYMREFTGVDANTGLSTWAVNYVDADSDGEYDDGEEIKSLTEYLSEKPNAVVSESTTTDYDNATQRYIGKSAIPDVRGALRLLAKFKGLELSAQFLYQFGGIGYDGKYAELMGNDKPGNTSFHRDILNRWQNPGDITNVPRLSANADANVSSPSSRFLTSSDYISLNNVRLGYSFTERVAKKLFLENLTLWISGDNLWLNSKRDGYNPTTTETGTSPRYNYAPLTTITGGIKVQF